MIEIKIPLLNPIKIPIFNPLTGALLVGTSAATVAIGANIRQHSVYKEAMTVFMGGLVTGAFAGSVGCCIPEPREHSSTLCKRTITVLKVSLIVAGDLTSPLMGDAMMKFGTHWGRVIVDELIGDSVIIGGLVGVSIVACLLFAVCVCCSPNEDEETIRLKLDLRISLRV